MFVEREWSEYDMNILAVDIGAGTQDIMVYNADNGFENAYKLVLPSPTQVFAAEVRRAREDVVIYGDTIGGGPFSNAVLNHCRKYKVFMTERAARTIRDDLSVVKEHGIQIISEDEVGSINGKHIRITDFNPELLHMLASFGVNTSFDVIAIAVQDHGVAPSGVSDRENRFRRLIEPRVGSELESFAYLDDAVPEYLSRMRSVWQSVKQWYDGHILTMDTGPAAVLGSLEDERVRKHTNRICINAGNAHTIAFSLKGTRVVGVFEHHTRMLDRDKLGYYVNKLSEGRIGFKEVFDDGGHGAVVIEANNPPGIISLTGPKRSKMSGLGIFATPGGDMMMTGPVGLIKAVESLILT